MIPSRNGSRLPTPPPPPPKPSSRLSRSLSSPPGARVWDGDSGSEAAAGGDAGQIKPVAGPAEPSGSLSAAQRSGRSARLTVAESRWVSAWPPGLSRAQPWRFSWVFSTRGFSANPRLRRPPSTLRSRVRAALLSTGSPLVRGSETPALALILSPLERFTPRGCREAEARAEVDRKRFSPALPGCERPSHLRAPGQQQLKARLRAVTCYFLRSCGLPYACVAVRVRARS